MGNEQERLLEQYFEPAHIARRRIPEQRLDAAIKNGMARGGKAQYRRRVGRVAASCAAVLLLLVAAAVYVPELTFGGRSASLQSAAERQIPAYVEWSVGKRGMLREALDQGKYQAVGATASYEGYHVTVDGIMTDRKHVVLFYTSKSDQGDRITPVNPGLYTKTYDKLPFRQFVRDHRQKTGYYDEGSYRDMLIFDLAGGTQLPDEFYFSGKWSNGEPVATQKFLEVKIPVDLSKLAVLERTIPAGQSFDLEGQKIKLETMVQVPERLNLKLTSDAGTPNIARFLDWGLYTKNDRGNMLQPAMGPIKENGELIFSFHAPDYVKGDPLELRGSGIETAFRGKRKLVIDTKQFKLIQAPDSRLKLASIETSYERIRITSGFPSFDPRITQFMKVNPEFTDGKGNKHKLIANNAEVIHEGWRKDADTGLDAYYFDIPGKAYPQPLTFEAEEYPGTFIPQTFSLTIQK